MDPKDKNLLWIAKASLKAPLPDPWKLCKSETEDIYFYNAVTKEKTWEHPCDKYYRDLYIKEKSNHSYLEVVAILNIE